MRDSQVKSLELVGDLTIRNEIKASLIIPSLSSFIADFYRHFNSNEFFWHFQTLLGKIHKEKINFLSTVVFS